MGQTVTSLPGGWRNGDVVYYIAAGHDLPSGDKLAYGEAGKIVGQANVSDGKDDQRVAVLFNGNSEPVACFAEALSREPPPEELPGGWRIGDTAIYTGDRKILENGDRLQPGVRCQIVGPAPGGDSSKVAVLCQGHAGPVLTSSLARDTSCWVDCTWCSLASNSSKIIAVKRA
mmetsp:Transcript_77806/g.174130  ORF Transcript_77806/g.174130 Transcript_77806/m.174130 type:complete len:173 (-) Transcript_77806:185-703(-)